MAVLLALNIDFITKAHCARIDLETKPALRMGIFNAVLQGGPN